MSIERLSSLRSNMRRTDQGALAVPELWLSARARNLKDHSWKWSRNFRPVATCNSNSRCATFRALWRSARRRTLGVRIVATLRDLRQRVREWLAGDSAQVDALIAAGGELAADIPRPRTGYVNRSVFWILRQDGRMIGSGEIRHRLTPFLRFEGGHIGLVLRPSERHKGYGARALGLLIDQAWKLGLKRILATCDAENEPSRRMIERSGGQLENTVLSHLGRKKLRYWIVPGDEPASPNKRSEKRDAAPPHP